jgi:nucleotide-binding universal stress UspA family protein
LDDIKIEQLIKNIIMKTILVPTDFSSGSENALYYAIEMAKKTHAKIILFHATHLNASEYLVPFDVLTLEHEKAQKNSELKLKQELLKIAHSGNIEYEYIDTDEEVISGISHAIENNKVDMVIMGTKSAGGLLNELFGSNTSNVIQKTNVPIIAVPEKHISREIKKITYATAFYSTDVKAIKRIVELAKLFRAQVNVLHVIPEDKNYAQEKDLMRNFMEEVNRKVNYYNLSFQLLGGKSISDCLENYLKSNDTNIMVMSTQQRNFFERLFQKSMTRKIALHTDVPLMAIHHTPSKSIKLFN